MRKLYRKLSPGQNPSEGVSNFVEENVIAPRSRGYNFSNYFYFFAMQADLDDAHYKKHVTDTGETREIVVCRDIYSYGGVKLLSAGARINSAMYERIVNHKLRSRLEESLSVANAVSRETLLECARQRFDRLPLLVRMQEALKPAQSILKVIEQIPLNQQLAFKLTIAQEKMPALFEHSVESAMFSAFLGFKADLDQTQLVQLATAGLFHDLGELHIDPALMDRKRTLTVDERKHFYVHPLSMYMLLKEFKEYYPAVSTAVLEHHERLDGSGYPRGLKQDELGRLGRILAVAELVASLYRGGENTELTRIETTLKLNMRHQLDSAAVSHMLEVLDAAGAEGQARKVSVDQLRITLQKMADFFADWNARFLPQLDAHRDNEALMFLSVNIHMLRHVLEDAGFNGQAVGQLTDVLEDHSAEALELESLYQEFVWKMRDMVNELGRRWPELEQPSHDGGNELVRDWVKRAQELISG